MRDRLVIRFGVALGLAALASVGCGRAGGPRPEMGRVHGTVTYKGNPVPKGTVTFFPVEGKGGDSGLPAIGDIGTDGSFELTTFDTGDGAILGQHKAVIVSKPEAVEQVASDMIPSQLPEDLKKTEAATKSLVPEKYSDPEKSPLRYTVRSGDNDFKIELKD